MRKFLHALLSVACLGAAAPGLAQDDPKCEPNPLFSRFPGERLDDCKRSRFAPLDMMRRGDPANPRSAVVHFKVEGEYWYTHGTLAKDAQGRLPGKLEVQRNFENAVREARGELLYTDEGGGRLHFRINRPDGEFWGISGCGGSSGGACTSVFHKMVRVAAMEQNVVVSAEQIAKGIADEGKAVFYGLYFDSGKSVLRPESAPTLVEMAKWLGANPASSVYIVGHTDMQGSADSNMSLSRARAAAVVDALVRQHGIKAERLGSEGVGPFAPMSNNTGDAGRARNRRVEMVLR